MTTLKEFRPGLWLTELSLDEFDVRGAVIIGDTHAVVWDTLSHPRDMLPVKELIGNKPTIIVYSHADWDHIWGTAGLTYQSIIGHTESARRFEGDVQAKLLSKQNQDSQWNDVILIPPTMSFNHQMTIYLGGVSLELHHLPGHTEDCIVGFIPEWGIFLAGDTAETPLPYCNDATMFKPWIEKLAYWAVDERVKTVIPAHGEIGTANVLTQTADYLQNLLDGKSIDIGESLTEFYRATHESNLQLVHALSKGNS